MWAKLLVLFAKLRDEDNKEVVFDKYSLAELANYSIRTNKTYADVIDQLSKNIIEIYYFEKKTYYT